MATLTNTANITNYQYNVTTGQTLNGTAGPAIVNLDVTAASVTFDKINTPQFITLGGSTTITYTIKNTNPEAITAVSIADPILSLTGVTITGLTNATQDGTTLNVTLGEPLAQNDSITVSLIATLADTALPSDITYNTTATGTFTLATTPISTVTNTDKDILEVNAAILQLTKSLQPTVATITAGNLLTYTISVANTGNVAATIPIGQFTDTWSTNGLTNVKTTTPDFQITNDTITNSANIIIAAGETFTLTYTGNAAVPV